MGIHPPRLPDPTAEAVEPDGHSRRGFLTRVAVGGAALAVGSQVVPVGGLLPLGAQEDDTVELDADETTLQFLASVALAAADAHGAGAEVAGIPETTVEVIRSFGANHRSQAAAFNALIPDESEVQVKVPNASLLSETTSALAGAADEAAVLGVLRDLTESIAATQLAALESMGDQHDSRTVANALGTISQQAVVLASLAGESVEDASPETQTTDGAITAADHPVSFPDEEGAAEEDPAEAEGSTTTIGETDESTTTTTEG